MAVPYKLNYFEIETGIDSTSTLIHSGDLTANKIIKIGGTSNDILLGNGTTASLSGLQPTGNYITALTGEATATGPGSVAITLTNSAVIGKLLTGLSITGSTIAATDTILQAFGKVQNQINGKQDAITLTTTGTSGAATLIGSTLNIPQYTDAFVGTVTSVSALTLGTTGTDLSSTVANSTTTPVITLNVPTASATNRGALSSTDWTTFNSKQDTITLTTSGSSGSSTFISNTLNVPTYTLSGLGGVPTTRTITINGTSQDLSADRTFSVGTVTSVGLSMPAAFSVASSPITGSGTIAVTGAGLASQYIRGDGQLADFPTGGGGGGSSVSYYLNGSVNQGTFGGNTYYEMNKVPVFGAGTDFTISADGYISQFLTDANDPNSLLIPAGNWNFETYFSASSGGGSPSFYVELYKFDGTTFTLIASNSATPELISFGTTIAPYFSALAVPETVLLATDRLAIRIYVNHSSKTITLHTENSHLCQVITTFTTGLQALNGLTKQTQYLAVGTSGTDFAISSATDTHTFNLPTASATNRGALSSANWSTFNNKQNAITLTTTGSSGSSTFIADVLNVPTYTLSGLGGVPTSRTITINGTSQDLSADRTYNVGTVTSVAALTLGTTGTDLSSTVANGTTTPVITLQVPTASATNRGALSSADWTSFNGKQDALSGTGIVKSTAGVISYLTDPLPIANGGTGSSTQNFVDLTTTQTIGGFKTFSNTIKLDNGTSNAFLFESGTTGFYTTLKAAAGLTTDIIVTLPSTTGTLALTSAIPANPVGGTGTTNTLPKFTSSTAIGDSAITDDGTTVTLVSRALSGTSASFSSTATASAFIPSGASVPTNGMYLSAANTLDFATNSTNRLSISSTGAATFSGNVSSRGGVNAYIGAFAANASSSQFVLGNAAATIHWSIFQTLGASGQQGSFNIFDVVASATRLTITSGGNVGIGTTSPTYKIHVVGGNFDQAILDNTGQQYTALDFRNNGTTKTDFYYDNTNTAFNIRTRVAGPLILSTNDTERMRITSGGNLLIGTSTDAGFKLDVNGKGRFSSSISNDYILQALNSNTTAGTSFGLYIKAGTNSSDSALVVNNAANTVTLFQVKGDGTATFSSSVTAGGTQYLVNTSTGTNQVYQRILSTGGDVVIGINANTGAALATGGLAYATSIYNNTNTAIQFGTNAVFNMTIAAGGNVGIGTTSPQNKFVASNGGAMGFEIDPTVSASVARTLIYNRGTSAYGNIENWALSHQFHVNGGTEAMRITSGGSVGINNSSPMNSAWGNDTNTKQLSINGSSYAVINLEGSTGRKYSMGVGDGNFYMCYDNTAARHNLTVTSGGEVLVGTTTTDVNTVGAQLRAIGLGIFVRSGGSCLQLNRLTSDGTIASFRTSDVERGSISIAGTVTSYNVTSDYRLKEDFKEVKGLEKVQAIKVYDYKWKSFDSRMDGVLAHELAEVLPYAVFGHKDEVDEDGNDKMQGVDYSKLVPVLVKAIQELSEKVKKLENK